MRAKIASPEDFLTQNVPFAKWVSDVKATIENRGGHSVLRLTSTKPVDEAVGQLIINVDWEDGRLNRTYNFLLDPPLPKTNYGRDAAAQQDEIFLPQVPTEQRGVDAPASRTASTEPSAPAVSEVPANTSASADTQPASPTRPRNASTSVPASTPASTPIPMPEPAADPLVREDNTPRSTPPATPEVTGPIFAAPPPMDPVPTEEAHKVVSGDTLSKIARANLQPDITLDQMMIALYRANPKAFIDEDINRVKTGAVLNIPAAEEARAIEVSDARRQVRAHGVRFNEYRQAIAARAQAAPVAADTTGASTNQTGQISTAGSARAGGDAVVVGSRGTDQAAKIMALEEDVQAKKAESQELARKLVEQEKLAALRKLEEEAKLAVAAKAEADRKAAEEAAAAQKAAADVAAAQTAAAGAGSADGTDGAAVQEAGTSDTDAATSAAGTDGAAGSGTGTTADSSKAVPVNYDPPEDLSDYFNGKNIGLVILALGLIVLFVGWRSLKKKKAEEPLETYSKDTSMFPGDETSIFGDNGGQSVNTAASSVIHTDYSQTGLSIETNEGVDPVAEADVYMAYGRDFQAEEILNDALKTDPKRGAIYVKLLEIYAQRQDKAQFEVIATELYARTQGQGRDWDKAVAMGLKLDPTNALFSGTKRPAQEEDEQTAGPLFEALSEPPSQLDLGATEGNTTLSNLNFSASEHTNAQLKQTQYAGKLLQEPEPEEASDVVFEMPKANEPAVDPQVSSFSGKIDFNVGRSRDTSTLSSVGGTASRPVQKARPEVIIEPARAVASGGQSSVASARVSNDLVAPLEFDLPDIDGGYDDATSTVVLPSVQGGSDRTDKLTMDLEKTSFDPHALDFDLDLDAADGTDVATVPDVSSEVLDAGEVDTKLELARAYEDMGDTEGALELLREVVAEGNAVQKATAQTLIDKLG